MAKKKRRRVGKKRPPIATRGKSAKNSWTSATKIKIAKMKREAMEFRVQGYGFREIGEELGISQTRAHELVVEALGEITQEPAEKLLVLELERADKLLAAHFSDAVAGDAFKTGTVLNVLARRDKLLGIVQKVSVEHSGPGGGPMETLNTNVNVNVTDKDRARALAAFIAKVKARGTEQ